MFAYTYVCAFLTHFITCLLRETPVGKINGTVMHLKDSQLSAV